MALSWRSLMVTSGQLLGGVQHYGYSSSNSCSYHWFSWVFSPSLRRRMWRDEIKAYQVDKSTRLVAWRWHEALKARNLSLHTRKSTLLFSLWPFWDCQSVLDWGWWELKISIEKEKRLETCCCRKQMMTLNASWACTPNCICDSGVGKEEERMEKRLLRKEQKL